MTQWWYGHNAVAFFLTAGFLGMMYYYLPKRAGRPIFSYRLSIISFWGITFIYMWAGSHHLHYTALPQWVQTLGMTFSVMLLVPSWASAGNALATQRRLAQGARRRDAALHDGRRPCSTACRPSKARSWRSARSTRCRTTPTGPSAMFMPARSAGWR
jgi:4-amino-4-deoxy-L-arabinose transferase-like glycosyltransferase